MVNTIALPSCLLALLFHMGGGASSRRALKGAQCECEDPPLFVDAVDATDTVLRAQILRLQKRTAETKTFLAKVKTVFKGSISKKRIKITVDADENSCGYFPFKKKEDYLIFQDDVYGDDDSFTVGRCFWNRKWEGISESRENYLNDQTLNDQTSNDQTQSQSFVRTLSTDPLPAEIPLADETVMEGYDSCSDLQEDLVQALSFYASNLILRHKDLDSSGIEEQVFGGTDAEEGDEEEEEEITEDSFGTNNQIEGVDEADIVKSDGTYVYLAYGDTLVVWNATSGDEAARVVMPRPSDVVDEDCESAEKDCFGRQTYANIDGILLDGDRLALIVSGYTFDYFPYIWEGDLASSGERAESVLSDYGASSIRIYDIGNLSGGGAPELLGTKDLKGVYDEGRSIGKNAHIATSTRVNTYAHIDSFLYKWKKRYDGLDDDEYVEEATAVAKEIVPLLASRIVTELDDGSQCSGIARLAAYVTADLAKDLDGDGEINNDEIRRVIEDALSFRSIVIVTSFDMDEDLSGLPVEHDGAVPTIPTESAVAFFGHSGPSIITASENRMIFTAKGYHWDDEDWSSSTCTYILVFKLPSGAEGGAAQPSALGLVEGSPINKFAIDEHEGHLRIGTTERPRRACAQFRTKRKFGYRFCSRWRRIGEVENQVIILAYPMEGDGRIMRETGRVDNLGKPGESLFALRFRGDKAFAVTFERTDPFYTLDLSDPTNPVEAGQLEITGFSTYLHLIEDEKFVLAVGQEADDDGRILGVAVSLFDVTDFEMPSLATRYVVEDDENLWSYSSASFDAKAFRYLPVSGVLILPLTTFGRRRSDFTDGFLVLRVDTETPEVSFKSFIDHAEVQTRNRCYSHAYLPSRSLVFKGNVTTMKGHVVMSTDLNTDERRWVFDIDEDREEEDCFGWFG